MHCVTMDNYSAQNFPDSCMVVVANQQHDISQSVNNQTKGEQMQTQEDNDSQQQTEQTQVTQVQPNALQNSTFTRIKLPAILDGEYFAVTKVVDSNVTVRCMHCNRHLNGNLKSTGNFLSHIKRVHPLLVDRIKCKSSQRKPATLYIDCSLKCEKPSEPSETTEARPYKYQKIEELTTNKNDSYEQPLDWNHTLIRPRRVNEEPEEITNQLRITTHNPLVGEDEYDAIGRNVAAKLRNMRIDQRIIAEKMLNDILFEAQLGNLSRDSNIHV